MITLSANTVFCFLLSLIPHFFLLFYCIDSVFLNQGAVIAILGKQLFVVWDYPTQDRMFTTHDSLPPPTPSHVLNARSTTYSLLHTKMPPISKCPWGQGATTLLNKLQARVFSNW